MSKPPPPYGVFDARVSDALRFAESDPEAAAKVLILASEYLEQRQQLPTDLADFLAVAFKSAALKPAEYRAKQLTDELFLTSNNRRPVKADWIDAYNILKEMRGSTRNASANALKSRRKISKTKADDLISKAAKYIEENE